MPRSLTFNIKAKRSSGQGHKGKQNHQSCRKEKISVILFKKEV
jgi:hypothetical protein